MPELNHFLDNDLFVSLHIIQVTKIPRSSQLNSYEWAHQESAFNRVSASFTYPACVMPDSTTSTPCPNSH